MFQNNQVFQPYRSGDTIPKPELVALLRQQYPDAKPATLTWHIHALVQQGLLARQGRGRYVVLAEETTKARFIPNVPGELDRWAKKLKTAFPLLTCCVWSTATLHLFMHQQPFLTYWLVETEREALGAVVKFLWAGQRQTAAKTVPIILATDLVLAERYQPDASTVVLVKPLISETPIQVTPDGLTVPTVEKILVDLVADSDVFDLFQEELPTLFAQLDEQYLLNYDRMRRYARRRHKRPDIDTYLAGLLN